MRTLINVAAAVLMLAPTLALNASMDAPPGSTILDDTAWRLSDLPGHTLLADRPVTMNLANGEVWGSDGCNSYRAPYSGDTAGFHLSGDMSATQMACPEAVMEQAAAFTGALSQARAARIEGKQLVLLDVDGGMLATLTAQDRGLPGTAWEVTGYNNGRQAVVSILAGSTLTLRFGADERVSGSAGCNDYTAAYSASGQTIEIGKVASTRKMCAQPEGVMEQEAAFLQALERATVFRIDGDRLELRSDEGALLVNATRHANASASPAPPSAAAAGAEGSTPAVSGAHGLRLPATFRGDLPCADCAAIRHHLDLWPDQVFHLRREWLGKPDAVRDDIGRWHVDPARSALILQGGAEMPLQLEIEGPDRLRQLDLQGRPIESALPYALVSDGTLTPTDLSLLLAGEMRYLADAARFSECLTGRSYPIAMEADYIDMERAYLAAASAPGAPLYVTFEGSIVPRPKMDGDGTEPSIVVT